MGNRVGRKGADIVSSEALWTRRALVKQLLGMAGAGSLLCGAAGRSDLRIGHLKTTGQWNPRPNALRRLLWEVAQRTSIEVDLEPHPLEPGAPEIFEYPFLYLAGSGDFSPFGEAAEKALRRHLTFGGTLLIDSADAEPGGGFDSRVRQELAKILPRPKFVEVPSNHVLYKTFYLVDRQAGRIIRSPYVEGLQIEKRFCVLYSQNDLAGAWARDPFGRWEYEVTPGGERQREMAFRLGINMVMYALCLDYKDDLVHTPFILRRRR